MDTESEMHFAKSSYEMFVFAHNHIISLSVVFFCLGSIFFFSSLVSDRLKRFLLIEPLIAIVTTFGGIVLVRFVAREFAWVVLISGVSLGLCYLAMIVIILYEFMDTSEDQMRRVVRIRRRNLLFFEE
jgi:ABC-type polysaccharide/polyol phosphate export permease